MQKYSKAVFYGDPEHQGLGVHNMYTTMVIYQLQALLDNIWKDNITGRLIRVSIESFKLDLGVTGPLFSEKYDVYGHMVTDCWVKHLWRFLFEHDIEVDEDTMGGEALRDGDMMLGDIFAQACYQETITKRKWAAANRCRLYLQALSVADIATGGGNTVDISAKRGLPQKGRVRNVQWPYQGKPGKLDWQVWRRVLKLTVYNAHQNCLHHRLGAYI